ncbi:MAG: DUF4280 domain-containing protein [Chryseobacterium sp.]|jgi:hypothetical protein|uniref:DUF4280 domain-containing protein n=1 Tax=Chryseobacterium sp. TaxID=1871047 RepID=UPI00282B2C1D|nr:DUF4280 domain-containing protein [Chryseobacterium sp.]MDR2238214.1 DUF4280 domain-containing protein [Chryseobacterium sp.]
MKNYIIQQGDTFSSLARQFKLKNEGILKTYHNLHCPPEDIMQQPIPGKTILIPEDPLLIADEVNNISDDHRYQGQTEASSGTNMQRHEQLEKEKSNSKKLHDQEQNKGSDAHEGKYFVIQKGIVQCNQGFAFPKFKVTSHQKHYWNDADGQEDYLAVTEDDLQFDPEARPFGQCKLKPSAGGYLPCTYAPTGKWQKPYEKVKVMGKSCLTEISELMCSTGGKITILKHGQQSEIGKNQVVKSHTHEQQIYNPLVDFDEFKENIHGTDELYYT